ncbi:MAG: heparan-alpha-glucosaminide N-acetyltransferase domain-containing protein [Bacteroidota bacterium]
MDTRHSSRITSIDILRGLVMIIMALDHTRDFFHVTAMTADPLATTNPDVPLYFTRWITHYCAPIFVFLSGLSAYLSSKNKTKAAASAFLLKRGFWLLVVEVVVITLGLTFNPLYSFVLLQVIWAIGWSMIILGLLLRFSFAAVLAVGSILFFGHNISDLLTLPQSGWAGNLVKILFTARGTILPVSSTHIIGVFYAILPWTGVMLVGYCVGYWYRKEFSAVQRKKLLLVTGLTMIGLFILLRFFNWYGEPTSWDKETILSFLNTSKYPPSLQYLFMTLGPGFVLLSLLENVHTKLSEVISVYGRVPFFYYVLHFYILHTLLVILFFATGYNASQIVDPQVPFLFRPANFGFNLVIVYVIWMSVVAVLYLPCRWFHQFKSTHSQWWLRYL